MNEERLLTEKEAAEFLGLSPATLRQQRVDGARRGHMPPIPYVRMGRAIRFRLSDLQRFVEANLVTP